MGPYSRTLYYDLKFISPAREDRSQRSLVRLEGKRLWGIKHAGQRRDIFHNKARYAPLRRSRIRNQVEQVGCSIQRESWVLSTKRPLEEVFSKTVQHRGKLRYQILLFD